MGVQRYHEQTKCKRECPGSQSGSLTIDRAKALAKKKSDLLVVFLIGGKARSEPQMSFLGHEQAVLVDPQIIPPTIAK